MRGTNDMALTGKILVFLDKCSLMGGSPSLTKGVVAHGGSTVWV